MVVLPLAVAPARWSLAPLALLLACGPQVKLETDTDGTGDPSGTGDTVAATTAPTAGTTDPDGGTDTDAPGPTERQVDILFVVDNSGSMGEEQAKLVASLGSLVAALDGAVPPVDYRIGVTTTDNGNPWCGTTGPEAGQLRLTSCRSRPSEFTFNGATTLEAFDEACAAMCPEQWANIEVQPTEVAGQAGAQARPWVESNAGVTNLPAGLSPTQALQCFVPQGIDGCGFESQLESLRKAILRSTTDGDQSFGFHRPGALLAVAIITDEVDCSYNNDHESIFLPDGNRVFWSDASAASPTSAVCWHAGVACRGDQCFSVNLDVDGNEVSEPSAEDDAVLRPLSRYTEQLLEVGAYVVAVFGVNADGSVTYAPSLMDPQYQSDFGIGPGCESTDGRAVPPVRMLEIIQTVSGPGVNGRSVCDADYQPIMTSFAQGIVDRLP